MGFSATGEISTLRSELRDDNVKKQKAAMTKLIELDLASSSDVSAAIILDALASRHTEDLGLKKLLYIFLSLNPNTVQDSNTFIRVTELLQYDLQHSNPLVRAAAAKFAGGLTELGPATKAMPLLRPAIGDPDPFVRKTAILAATRLYREQPGIGAKEHMTDAIQARLQDESPMVVVNALASLRELRSTCGVEVELGADVVKGLLQAMEEGSEWGQALILEAVADYVPTTPEETRSLVERVLPSLNGANSAVVLGAGRVLLGVMERGDASGELEALEVGPKVGRALVRILGSTSQDIQWTVLRSITLVLKRWPGLLEGVDVRNFYIRYNDPPHIKKQKLNLLGLLPDEESIGRVVLEMREYATDVDPDIARHAISVLGTLAVKMESCAESVVSAMVDLISSKHASILQAIMPAMALILRRYPGRFEAAIAILCDALDEVEDPLAKGAMVWMIGEYAERVEGAVERLELFVDTWKLEALSTRLALLTAAAKLHLKVQGPEAALVVKKLLESGNQDDSPDIRERALFYWRLLAHDPELAKQVVLAPRPVAGPNDVQIDDDPLSLLLVTRIPQLAAILGLEPSKFILSTSRMANAEIETLEKRDASGVLEPISNSVAKLALDTPNGTASPTAASTSQPSASTELAAADVASTSSGVAASGSGNFPPPKLDLFDILTSDTLPPKDNSLTPGSASSSQATAPQGPYGVLPSAPASEATTPAGSMPPTPSTQAPAPSNATAAKAGGASLGPLFSLGASSNGGTQTPDLGVLFGGATPASPVPPPAAGDLPPPQPTSSPRAPSDPSHQTPFAIPSAQHAFGPVATPGPAPTTAAAAPNLAMDPLATMPQQALLQPQNSSASAASSSHSQTVPPPNALFTAPVHQPVPMGMMNNAAPLWSQQFVPQNGGMLQTQQYIPQNTGGMYQPQHSGGMYQPQNTGGFYQPQNTGGMYQPQYTGMQAGGMYQAQYTGMSTGYGQPGGMYQPQYTGMSDGGSMQWGMGGPMGGPLRATMAMGPGGMGMGVQPGFNNFGASQAFAPGQMAQMTGGMMGGGQRVLSPVQSVAGTFQAPPPRVLLRQESGLGLEIRGQFVGKRSTGYMRYRLELVNRTRQPLSNFLIQFNHNRLGLAPANVSMDVTNLQPDASAAVEVPCCIKPNYVSQTANDLAVAIKTDQLGVLYFSDEIPYHVMD